MTPEEIQAAEQDLRRVPEFSWLTGSPAAWWNVSEVAKGMGVGRPLVTAWCEDGKIPGALYYEGAGWRMPRSGLVEYFAGLQRDAGRSSKAG